MTDAERQRRRRARLHAGPAEQPSPPPPPKQAAPAPEPAPLAPLPDVVKLKREITRLEREITQLKATFHHQVSQEVTRHINEFLLPRYAEKLRQAELLMKRGKPFTKDQFLGVLLRALHPDTTSAENRHDAFILLKEKEVALRPEEREKPLSGGLPTSLEELLKRRKTKR